MQHKKAPTAFRWCFLSALMELFFVKLQGIQIVVPAVLGKQLLMGSLLHDHTLGQQNDVVRVLDGGKTVGNHQHGADISQLHQRVQDHHRRLVDDGTGKA